MKRKSFLSLFAAIPFIGSLSSFASKSKGTGHFTTLAVFSHYGGAGMAVKVTYPFSAEGVTAEAIAKGIRDNTPDVFAFVMPDGNMYNIITREYREEKPFRSLADALEFYDKSGNAKLDGPAFRQWHYEVITANWNGKERKVTIPAGKNIAFIEQPNDGLIYKYGPHRDCIHDGKWLSYDHLSLPLGFTPGDIEHIAQFTGRVYYNTLAGKKPEFITLTQSAS